MKLLFDQNLSRKLVPQLEDLYPSSEHVSTVGLDEASDETVWNHARDHDLVIVTKDTDFHQRCFLYGPPPKVVWIRTGNCTTGDVATLLRASVNDVRSFVADDGAALLVLD